MNFWYNNLTKGQFMQTIRLNIDDSIFEKFMGLLEILPKNKISIKKENTKESFIVSSKDEVEQRILKAENSADYTNDKDFWSNIDTKIENI